MTTCPSGHDSTATDYCDVCGMRMAAPAPSAAAPAPPADPSPVSSAPSVASGLSAASGPSDAPQPSCPRCGAKKEGQFCETCGFDFDSPVANGQPEPPAHGWAAVVSADCAYFDALIAA